MICEYIADNTIDDDWVSIGVTHDEVLASLAADQLAQLIEALAGR